MTKDDIEAHLNQIFLPSFITIEDDSAKHHGHQGTKHTQNTHFNVIIVSQHFEGLSLIERHRAINNALKDACEGTLHALKITAKTPKEWTH
jgi:BolA protein